MNALNFLANASSRFSRRFPGWFQEAKHDLYADFGYPTTLEFEQLYVMYLRNGLARAGIDKTIGKTWETKPELWETEDPKETPLEEEIRKKFDDLRLWQLLAEADRRSMVGGYAGVILRFADSKLFSEPADTVPGGIDGLVELIPAWSGQLTVSSFDLDERSPTYGKPAMFQFNESNLSGGDAGGIQNQKPRAFPLHPTRVIVWSEDGTVHCRSSLEPGYNDLIDMEKIKGAGGEGFWKNAKSAPVLHIPPEVQLKDMAKGMGVGTDEVFDMMNTQVEDWQKGFDKLLMLQGMEAKTLGIVLPSPEHFFNIALQSFAASMDIPLKILVGNQTGERASTEDANSWSMTNMSRRSTTVEPSIQAIVRRLEAVKILPEKDWHIHWQDLTESSSSEKIERAEKMANINQKQAAEPVFLVDEIRAVVGLEPIAPIDGEDEEE